MVAAGLIPRMTIFALMAISSTSTKWWKRYGPKQRMVRHKVSLRKMDDFLQKYSLSELFNLLPAHFAPYQRDVVEAIRSLAINCFKEHHDPDLSKGVLVSASGLHAGASNSPHVWRRTSRPLRK